METKDKIIIVKGVKYIEYAEYEKVKEKSETIINNIQTGVNELNTLTKENLKNMQDAEILFNRIAEDKKELFKDIFIKVNTLSTYQLRKKGINSQTANRVRNKDKSIKIDTLLNISKKLTSLKNN